MFKTRHSGTPILLGLMFWFVCIAAAPASGQDEPTKADHPWWDQQKIRFFWSQWGRFKESGISPEGMLQRLSQVGATVYVEHIRAHGPFNPDNARLAHKYGMRYFGSTQVHIGRFVARNIKARLAVNKHGFTSLEEAARGMNISEPPYVPCPLDKDVIDEWFIKPTMEAARSGLADGMHIDWEHYGANAFGDLGEYQCYCEDCFGRFMKARQEAGEVPPAQRYKWLKDQGLLADYLLHLHDRLRDVYRGVAEQVHKINPEFIFSAYPGFVPDDLETLWRVQAPALGLNSPTAPFFVIDPSHYESSHAVPWWETQHLSYRKLGMKHILGTWTGGAFGGCPERDISVTQFMFDAAINHDGCWMWSEHNWGPNDYRVHRTVDRRIRTIENKVGEFLLRGKQDNTFVCVVEQSGSPVLGRNIIQRSYHLADRHLVHINNVNTDIPVEVLIRFPRLDAETKWTVTDPISGLCYTHSGRTTTWAPPDLARGGIASMEKRSEAWLLLSPASASVDVDSSMAISADVIKGHPDSPGTGSELPVGTAVSARFPVVYLKTGPLDYPGSVIPVTGTSVHSIDAVEKGTNDKRLFGINGNCWSPALSPDGKRIVFACYVNGKGQLYVVNADGSNPYNISNNDACDNAPAWSPDGKRIAFVSDRDGDWEIYASNADGSGQRRLTHSAGVDHSPTWSPDGRMLAFESDRDGDFDIYVINGDGTEERCLVRRAGNDVGAAWSPDGKRIACAVSRGGGGIRDILLTRVDGGATPHPEALVFALKYPKSVTSLCWSPDGKQIAGGFEGLRGKAGIFTIASDGTKMRELVTMDAIKPYPGGEGLGHVLMGGWYFNGSASRRWLMYTFKDISWSPDGSRLAFCSDMDSSGYFFMYTISKDGGAPTRLDATLSPTGPRNSPISLREGGTGVPNVPGLDYSTPARSLDGADYSQMISKLKLVEALPVAGWSFRGDVQGLGVKKGYFLPGYDDSDWALLLIDRFWDKQGYPPDMPEGWYRLRYSCPELPDGKRVFLKFGSIDEAAGLYVDGRIAAWYDPADPGKTWDKPVLLEVTGNLKTGQEHLLVVRVKNSAGAGGIWKPVSLMVEQ